MARMLATFLLLLSFGAIIFNHVNGQDSEHPSSCMWYINDCSNVVHPSGVYTIIPPNTAIQVYCEAYIEGGWTVFQRRYDGSINFFRGWDEYVNGFGSYDGEFWLGLEKLHQLTRNGTWRLKVLLQDWDGSTAYAEYDSFRIGDEASNFTLTIAGYSGTAGDSLESHNGMAFSTKDRDNDQDGRHCASAWWNNGCSHSNMSNLNGPYPGQSGNNNTAMHWYHWKNFWQYAVEVII